MPKPCYCPSQTSAKVGASRKKRPTPVGLLLYDCNNAKQKNTLQGVSASNYSFASQPSGFHGPEMFSALPSAILHTTLRTTPFLHLGTVTLHLQFLFYSNGPFTALKASVCSLLPCLRQGHVNPHQAASCAFSTADCPRKSINKLQRPVYVGGATQKPATAAHSVARAHLGPATLACL